MQNSGIQVTSKKITSLNILFNKLGKSKSSNPSSGFTAFFSSLVSNLKSVDVEKVSVAGSLLNKSVSLNQNKTIKTSDTLLLDFPLLSGSFESEDNKDISLINKVFFGINMPDLINQTGWAKTNQTGLVGDTPKGKNSDLEIKTGSTLKSFLKTIENISAIRPGETKIISKLLKESVAVQKAVYTIIKEISKLSSEQNAVIKGVGFAVSKEKAGDLHVDQPKKINRRKIPAEARVTLKSGKKEKVEGKEIYIGRKTANNKVLIELKNNSVTITAHKGLKTQLGKAASYLKNFVRSDFNTPGTEGVKKIQPTQNIIPNKVSAKVFKAENIERSPLKNILGQVSKGFKEAKVVHVKGQKSNDVPGGKEILKKPDATLFKPKQVEKPFLINDKSKINNEFEKVKIIHVKGQKSSDAPGEKEILKKPDATLFKPKHVEKPFLINDKSKIDKELGKIKIVHVKGQKNSDVIVEKTIQGKIETNLFTANELKKNPLRTDVSRVSQSQGKSKSAFIKVQNNTRAVKPALSEGITETKTSAVGEDKKYVPGSLKNLFVENKKPMFEATNIKAPLPDDAPIKKDQLDFNVNKNIKIKFVFTNEAIKDTQKLDVVQHSQKQEKSTLQEFQNKNFTLNEILKKGMLSSEIKKQVILNPMKSVIDRPHLISDLTTLKVKNTFKKKGIANPEKMENKSFIKMDETVAETDIHAKKVAAKGPAKINTQLGFPGEPVLNKRDMPQSKEPDALDISKLKKTIQNNEMGSAFNTDQASINPGNQPVKIITGALPKMVAPAKYLSGIIHKYYDSATQNFTQSQIIVDGGEMGKLDIRLNKNSAVQTIVILVENETIKTELARILPHLAENLQGKGVQVNSVYIEVGQSWNKNNKRQNERNNEKTRYSQTKEGSNDKDAIINLKRFYGYNTMDIIA